MNTKLYILTVTKNDLSGLKKTVNSIENLNSNIKIIHIIKNAKKDISSRYIEKLNKSEVERILVDNKDSGIYDGMNQAMEYVPNGQMFIFINSGDIIRGIINADFKENYYLLDAYLNLKKSNSNKKIKIKKGYIDGMPFNHQSLISRKQNNMLFDCSFKISADYLFVLQWVSKQYKSPKLIPKLNSAYIIYDGSGISSSKKLLRDYEAFKAILFGRNIFSAIVFCIIRFRSLPRYIWHKLGINL